MTIGIFGPDPYIRSAYAIQAGEMAKRLKADGYDVVILGNQHTSSPVQWEGITVTPYLKDPFLMDSIEYWIDEYKIDTIVYLFNFWTGEQFLKLREKKGIKYIIWTPVEGKLEYHSLTPTHHRILEGAAAVISTSEWTQKQLRNAGHDSVVIRSGVSEKLRLLPRYETREKLGLEKDSFIVGFVGRNHTERKLIPYVMKTYAEFLKRIKKEEREKCILYLHTNREYASRTYDLERLIGYFGLRGRVMLPKKQIAIDPLDDGQMNEIYNTFDVMLFPSMGEGQNVPLMEAMYLGIPCIVHYAHSHMELVDDTDYPQVPTITTFFPMISGMVEEEALPNLRLYTSYLHMYYRAWKQNRGTYFLLGARAAEKAKEWTWDNSYAKFREILEKVLQPESAPEVK
jgi:glycosyltransferase involved in cell wall biosynthesis